MYRCPGRDFAYKYWALTVISSDLTLISRAITLLSRTIALGIRAMGWSTGWKILLSPSPLLLWGVGLLTLLQLQESAMSH